MSKNLLEKVTRVVIVDHTEKGEGRILDRWNCRVRFDYQDDARTLKVFVLERSKDK